MSFTSILKGIGRGVQKTSNAFDRAMGAQPAPQPAPQAAPQAQAPAPTEEPEHKFSLPELDPDDPDFEEKKAIHDIFSELEGKLTEAAPHIDFQKEYSGYMKKQREGAPEQPRMNPFSQFAIAMGAGKEGLDRAESTRRGEQDRSDRSWQEALDIQREAIKGDIQQKMEQGKFKQALAQSEALMKLEAVRGRISSDRKHTQALEIEREKTAGRVEVQSLKDNSARERLTTRLNHVADAYQIEGKLRAEFFKQVLGMYMARLKQQDVTGEPIITGDDFNKTLKEAVDWAEEHSTMDLNVPPGRPGQKSPATTPTSGRPSGEKWREAAGR